MPVYSGGFSMSVSRTFMIALNDGALPAIAMSNLGHDRPISRHNEADEILEDCQRTSSSTEGYYRQGPLSDQDACRSRLDHAARGDVRDGLWISSSSGCAWRQPSGCAW
jgi:hypothetical protein